MSIELNGRVLPAKKSRNVVQLKICCMSIMLLLLCGCQPKVYLMPSPVSLGPESSLFDLVEDNKDGNLLYTLYATSRVPLKKVVGFGSYSISPSDSLRLGLVVHGVGEEGMSWEDLHRLSVTDERDEDLLISEIYTREMVHYDEDEESSLLPAQAEGFFDQVNKAIEKRYIKDILVYVHGANSNFYRATAQGAQMYHFTGHNTLLLTFSWPSAENILRYKVDVLHAGYTVPNFARLLEILANHTEAEKINILSYSAGAQVVAPGLEYLRDKYAHLTDQEVKEKFRLGELYLAAPDHDMDTFIQRYLKFRHLVDRTTITLNKYDRVLRLAEMQSGVSKLGRPRNEDVSYEDEKFLVEASQTATLDVIDIAKSKSMNVGGAHDFWYNHPWVSNDLLLLLLFKGHPLNRGLAKSVLENDLAVYYFPEYYDTKIAEILSSRTDDFYREYYLWKSEVK